ncbi:glucose-fructose oxidoreductase [Verrucomicrobiota bacterium]|nr:glucose--fructose oxidoreductase [Verrucomicrobiota bacterium]GDY18128.1 glucose-fructose oxidoreductase [Verrucomicrobiota bacterium]
MSPTRRAFLGSLGGLAAGYALAPALRAAEAGGKPLGLALCGLGGYSNGELSPALLETKHVKLVAAITGTRAKGEKLAKLHGFPETNIYSYDQWDQVAANKAIDVVYVVTPPGIHAQNVIAAFGAGKHVICEKPMATSVAECDAMIAAGKKAGKRLAIGYRLHYDPYHQELIRLARSQEFGPFMKMTSANGFTLRRKVWRIDKKLAGGGSLLDMGIYSLHACCMAADANPVAVTAKELPKTQPEFFTEVEEALEFRLDFANGAVANVWTGYNANRAEFLAEAPKGWFKGERPVFSYRNLNISTSTKGKLDFGVFRQQQRHMDGVAAAFRDDQPLTVTGELGRRDMVVIAGIYESIKTGKKVELKYA